LNEQGAIYYINHATGVTSSTPPKPQPVPQKPAPAAAATKPTLRAPGNVLQVFVLHIDCFCYDFV